VRPQRRMFWTGFVQLKFHTGLPFKVMARFKVRCGDELRRFSLDNPTLRNLKIKISSFFPVKCFVVQYEVGFSKKNKKDKNFCAKLLTLFKILNPG
jgi:hypothetical protein